MPLPGSRPTVTSGGTRRQSESGTALANIELFWSDTPSDGEARPSGWGGARLRAGRTSDGISLEQASEIIEAAQFAVQAGLPFNRHLVIHWERAGILDVQAAVATGRFLTLVRDWIRKRGGCTAWEWVRENGGNKGSHVHILLHVPAGLALGAMGLRWLKRVTGARYRKGVIRTRRIGGTARTAVVAPAAYRTNLAVVVCYILKGATPSAACALGIGKRQAGGCIIGKRVATSENIGRAARARHRQARDTEAYHPAVPQTGRTEGQARRGGLEDWF